MSDTENAKKTAKETELYKLFKPPKPIEIALPQFFKDLIVLSIESKEFIFLISFKDSFLSSIILSKTLAIILIVILSND